MLISILQLSFLSQFTPVPLLIAPSPNHLRLVNWCHRTSRCQTRHVRTLVVKEHTCLLSQIHVQQQPQTLHEHRVQWTQTQLKTERGHKEQPEECTKQTSVSCFPFVFKTYTSGCLILVESWVICYISRSNDWSPKGTEDLGGKLKPVLHHTCTS